MLYHYIKIAFRDLWKHKNQVGICTVGIAIGLVCFTFCAYYAQLFTGYDTHYPDADRIFVVADRKTESIAETADISWQLQQYPEIVSIVDFSFTESVSTIVRHENGKDYFFDLGCVEIVDASWFNFFSISPIEGYISGRPGEMVLTQQAAQKLFPGESAIGKQIEGNQSYWEKGIRNMQPVFYTVCAVIPDIPRKSIFNIFAEPNAKLDGLLINEATKAPNEWKTNYTAVKLAPTASLEAVNQKLESFRLAGSNEKAHPEGIYLAPFSAILSIEGGIEIFVLIGLVIFVGLLVLLVALFNFVSLVLGLFINRLKECSIRKAFCANQRHLWLMFCVEIFIPVIIAGVFGAFLFVVLHPHFNGAVREFFRIDIQELLIQFILYIIAGLFIAALLCLIPSNMIHRLSVRTAIFGGSSAGRKSRVRMFLLGLQLFVCVLFVSGSMMMARQFRYLENKTLSSLTHEEKENIIEIPLEREYIHILRPHAQQIVHRLSQNPLCDDILPARWQLASGWSRKYTWEGLSEDWWYTLQETETSADYPIFMKQPIVEGRMFEQGNKTEVVVNEVVRHLLGGQAIGKTITCIDRGQSFHIVGVIADGHEFTPDRRMRPAAYFPIEQPGYLYVKLKGSPRETSDFIMQTIRQYLPENVDYKLHTLKDSISKNDMLSVIFFRLILLFSSLSLIIGLSGVFSSISLNTSKRRKEIAIRKINGASLIDVIRMFLRKYILLLLIVSIPAFVAAYGAVGAWLNTQPYRAPLSLWWFIPVFVLMTTILVATVLHHLYKTARKNPVETLKLE